MVDNLPTTFSNAFPCSNCTAICFADVCIVSGIIFESNRRKDITRTSGQVPIACIYASPRFDVLKICVRWFMTYPGWPLVICDTTVKIFAIPSIWLPMIFVPVNAIGPSLWHGFRECWSDNHEWRRRGSILSKNDWDRSPSGEGLLTAAVGWRPTVYLGRDRWKRNYGTILGEVCKGLPLI